MKDAVIQRFNGTTPNPKTWITNLEHECIRLDIPPECNCEVLRLFLDGIANEWFSTAWTLHRTSSWAIWKQSFIDHFATRSWLDTSYAINFKYKRGSLSEYVIKKLSLLADSDPNLSDFSRIAIVIAGIPYEWHFHLDRDKIKTTNNLITKINQIDKLCSRSPPALLSSPSSSSTTVFRSSQTNQSNRNRKTCPFCDSIGKPGRFHSEAECLTKKYRSQSNSGNLNKPNASSPPKANDFPSSTDRKFKLTHNTELEDLFNSEINSKN